MIVVGGWTIFAHPLLLDKLTAAVAKAASTDPEGYGTSANAKLLAMVRNLILDIVPRDPGRAEHRQGDTLGAARTHWFPAKFGNGRFRLFFRYDGKSRIIIIAWVNDRDTLRTDGSETDAYRVFGTMLDKGHPPDDWTARLDASSTKPATTRLHKARLLR